MTEDRHLKVRAHAAMALKMLPGVSAYGNQIRGVLEKALCGLQAHARGDVALQDPSQLR